MDDLKKIEMRRADMEQSEKGLLRVAVYDFALPTDKAVIALHVFRTVDDRGLIGLLYQLALHHLGTINEFTHWHVCVQTLPLDFMSDPVRCFDWYPFKLVKTEF